MPPRGLLIPTAYDLTQARRDLQTLKAESRKTGAEAGDVLIRSLRDAMNAKVGQAREALARGLIDKNEFRKISQDAAREFNSGILKALEQLRREGKQGTAEFERLQRALKNVGTAGTQAGREVKRGFMDQVKDLPGFVKC
jgi:hypothetical protein